ncbi:SOS response-associated peptidase [Lederbergia wuyishanensis]|uniref:Abasic site processing protein n=1 Tax=Lederbergia wuyishanensis TaxID=1347903 RepID=A0ABU0D9W6_9BACI|nr:SOS response-associated peptidase [Lederbergia wuyishanensis]MCJ8008484.1 SOS response-associated peptidase [Lederbergia wuyishanensis]MDQ0345227.1 putative SOS response-associated peptidase YedK [Lederbergia wuyishanensis]
MCGRYSLFTAREDFAVRFGLVDFEEFEWVERYNIAPSQNVLAIVRSEVGNKMGMLKWGLIPSWASDPKIGYKMINARAETIDQKPSFKMLLKRRRCIIPADGFYEWKKEGTKKIPYRFQLESKEPFAFAGLWDRWEQNGSIIQSCTIITTEANALVKDVHDRMPVILTKESENKWLDRTNQDENELKSLLVPFAAEKMQAYTVSPLVNSPKNDVKQIVNSL